MLLEIKRWEVVEAGMGLRCGRICLKILCTSRLSISSCQYCDIVAAQFLHYSLLIISCFFGGVRAWVECGGVKCL